MSKAPLTDAAGRGSASLHGAAYRYFFYGWMFRDAATGSPFERAAALRHNRSRARWLPVYLRRWAVTAALLFAGVAWAEQSPASALLAAVLAIALVLALVFVVVTAICWTALRSRRGFR